MKQTIYCIGYAHIDPVWLWTWQEGFAEIKATFRSALDRIRDFDDFVFTCAGASYYQWVEENEPAMFEEIQREVARGRWVLAGGMWLQPDCNAPCGESFVRQGLYSQKYFYQKFGKLCTFGYNVDSFGHNGNLPQIYNKLRMANYVMMRPQAHEKGDIRHSLFQWQGIDGSILTTFRIPIGYGTCEDGHDLEGRLSLLAQEAEQNGYPSMLFYGVGNHGGGPTRAAIHTLHQLNQKYGALKLGSPEEFFASVHAGKRAEEVVHGDLQHHAIGCYSANSTVKKTNRRAENRLLMAEKFSSIAAAKFGLPYPARDLEHAWHNVLFNQFHDIMGGCSIKEAYDDVREFHGEALGIAARHLNAALQKISWNVDTLGERVLNPYNEPFRFSVYEENCGGFPLVIFNPNAFAVTAPITLSKEVRGVVDECGRAIPFQNVRATKTTDEKKPEVVGRFLLDLPALGYRTVYFKRFSGFEGQKSENMLRASGHFLENRWFRLEINPTTGTIRRLYDKEHGVEFAGGDLGLACVLEDQQFDTWAHATDYLGDCIGAFGNAKIALIEYGEVEATVRTIAHYNHSMLEQRFTLYRDARDIDVEVRVNWQEPFKTLKLAFPLRAENPRAFYEIPYGCIEKPANGMEEAGQSFVAVAGEQNGTPISLSVVTEGRMSYSVNGSQAQFVALRSCGFADHYGIKDEFTQVQDLGVQELRYSLVPEVGAFNPAASVKKACQVNQKPIVIYETFHKGALPLRDSYASVSNDEIVLSALKPSENGGKIVLRLYEISGKENQAEVALAHWKDAKISLHFKPFELKTVCVNADGTYCETDLLENDFL